MTMDKEARRMQKTIQMARRKLGLDDGTYRDFLESATATGRQPGKRSTGDMNNQELWRVIQALKAKGFALEPQQGDITKADDPQSTLIRHLWLTLKSYGELRNPSERALAQYVKRIAKVDRLEWLKVKQAQQVIETLKNWVARIEDKLINEALQNGRLCLPGGFTSYAGFVAAFHAGSIDVAFYEEVAKFRQAVEHYLGNYKPEKQAAGNRRDVA